MGTRQLGSSILVNVGYQRVCCSHVTGKEISTERSRNLSKSTQQCSQALSLGSQPLYCQHSDQRDYHCNQTVSCAVLLSFGLRCLLRCHHLTTALQKASSILFILFTALVSNNKCGFDLFILRTVVFCLLH